MGYQGVHYQYEAGGVTARNGDSLRVPYKFALAFPELGKSVRPAFGHPVGGRAVYDTDGRVFDQADGLAGRVIR